MPLILVLVPPAWLAVDEGGVWHADPLGGIAFIDAATNTVTRGSERRRGLDGIAVGEGAVWAMNATDDSIMRIDPHAPAEAWPGSASGATRQPWLREQARSG